MRSNGFLVLMFLLLSCAMLPAQDLDIPWLIKLTDEISNETDLCERCDKLPPTISLVRSGGEQTVFLRYGCTPLLRRTLQYSLDGTLLGTCEEDSESSTCGLNSIATIFTLSSDVETIWSCLTGFTCEFNDRNSINKELPINIDNRECDQGIKRLWVSLDYVQYEWESDNGEQFTDFSISITQPGEYKVTATDFNGCQSYGSVVVESIEKVDFTIKGKPQLCVGGTTELFATGFETYRWSDGTSGNSIKVQDIGEYKVTVTNVSGCEGEASFELIADESLGIQIVATPDDIFEGATTQLSIDEAVSEDLISEWEWSGDGLFDCVDCASPMYTPTRSGEIILNVVDADGCKESATYDLQLKELPLVVYTPNVILPNDDFPNGIFTIYGGPNIEIVETLQIYDRWGGEVFSESNFPHNDPKFGWYGILSSDTEASNHYAFSSRVRFTNGKQKVFKGSFTVLK